jgi:hypothetical protein
VNCPRFGILIVFFRSVALSKITRLFFAIAFASCYSISITIHCASTIVYTFMAYCTFNYIFVDSCCSYATMLSSLASFYTMSASTKWCSLTLSSFDSSMHTKSIDVTPHPLCSLTRQRHLLMRKNSITYVQIVFISWIIIYTNYIFSLYTLPFAHSEDDDECNGNLTTNNWIFNTFFFVLLNSFFTFVFFNNLASSSCLHLCSLLYTFFSLAICCSFSIALSALILL